MDPGAGVTTLRAHSRRRRHLRAEYDRRGIADDDGDPQGDVLRYNPARHEPTSLTEACSCLSLALDTILPSSKVRQTRKLLTIPEKAGRMTDGYRAMETARARPEPPQG